MGLALTSTRSSSLLMAVLSSACPISATYLCFKLYLVCEHVCICTQACACACVCLCVYVCVCLCMYVCIETGSHYVDQVILKFPWVLKLKAYTIMPNIFKKDLLIFKCIWLCLCWGMSTFMHVPMKTRRGHWVPWSWSYRGCETSTVLNPGLLKDLDVLLAAEPSLQVYDLLVFR